MALTIKEKELVYVGASVSAGCKPVPTIILRRLRKQEHLKKKSSRQFLMQCVYVTVLKKSWRLTDSNL